MDMKLKNCFALSPLKTGEAAGNNEQPEKPIILPNRANNIEMGFNVKKGTLV